MDLVNVKMFGAQIIPFVNVEISIYAMNVPYTKIPDIRFGDYLHRGSDGM